MTTPTGTVQLKDGNTLLGNFTAVPDADASPLVPDDVPPPESCFKDSGARACPAAEPPCSRPEEEALDPLLPPLHAVSATGPATNSASKPAAAPAFDRQGSGG